MFANLIENLNFRLVSDLEGIIYKNEFLIGISFTSLQKWDYFRL